MKTEIIENRPFAEILLTSRADSLRVKLASCAVGKLAVHYCRNTQGG